MNTEALEEFIEIAQTIRGVLTKHGFDLDNLDDEEELEQFLLHDIPPDDAAIMDHARHRLINLSLFD